VLIKKHPYHYTQTGVIIMPLSMIGEGETATITRVGGKEETRRFLENLGFVVGAIVTVISKTGGNVIVNIKESRVAIGKDMATKIMV
jgi:ferrous iron transport protein A